MLWKAYIRQIARGLLEGKHIVGPQLIAYFQIAANLKLTYSCQSKKHQEKMTLHLDLTVDHVKSDLVLSPLKLGKCINLMPTWSNPSFQEKSSHFSANWTNSVLLLGYTAHYQRCVLLLIRIRPLILNDNES